MAEDAGSKLSIHSDLVDSFNSFSTVLDILRVVDRALMVDEPSPAETALATVLAYASTVALEGRAAAQRALDVLGTGDGRG